MNLALIAVIFSQLFFSVSDIMARYFMRSKGFHMATFLSTWFFVYFFVRLVATFGQLYVFSSVELGKTAILFALSSLIIANLAGVLLLGEILSLTTYIGLVLAVLAIIIVGLSKVTT